MQENGARNIENDADIETGYNDISAGVPGTVSGLATGTTAGYGASAVHESSGLEAAERSANVGETAIPIVEESLVVGEREVERGGVRVYSHIVKRL